MLCGFWLLCKCSNRRDEQRVADIQTYTALIATPRHKSPKWANLSSDLLGRMFWCHGGTVILTQALSPSPQAKWQLSIANCAISLSPTKSGYSIKNAPFWLNALRRLLVGQWCTIAHLQTRQLTGLFLNWETGWASGSQWPVCSFDRCVSWCHLLRQLYIFRVSLLFPSVSSFDYWPHRLVRALLHSDDWLLIWDWVYQATQFSQT